MHQRHHQQLQQHMGRLELGRQQVRLETWVQQHGQAWRMALLRVQRQELYSRMRLLQQAARG